MAWFGEGLFLLGVALKIKAFKREEPSYDFPLGFP